MNAIDWKPEGRRGWIVPLLLSFLVWLAPFQLRAAPLTGDPANGKDIAETKHKCVRCHGDNGVSDSPDTPHLAAQNAAYLLKQMKDYQSKARVDSLMYKRVRRLTEQEMTDIALWYQSQPLPEIEPVSSQKLQAPQLVLAGDPSRGIVPCVACHGMDGKTVAGDFPAIAGQPVEYLISTMQYYRDGLRTNDAGMMTTVTKKMTDAEFEEIAKYYAALGGRPAK